MPSNIKSLLLRSLFASSRNSDDHFDAFSQVCLQTICGLQFILVCDLHGAVENLPDEVDDLVHIKYLRLSSSFIRKLPRIVANLQKLQTLDVNCSILFQLPVEIMNIKQLRHLLLCDIIEYRGGIRVPRGIGTLVNLQTLTGSYAGAGRIASELSNLTKLRKLDVQDVSEDHAGELFASVRKLENLVSLSINAEEAGSGTLLPDLEAFSPPPHLQELSLAGGLIEMPSWLPSIENLSSLALCHSKLLENSSLVLQFLPKLKHLNLWETYNAKIIGKEFCEAGGFPELETLIIASGDLVEWTEIVFQV